MHYYGQFYRSECVQGSGILMGGSPKWARRKYKRFGRRERASMHGLRCMESNLFVLWRLGIRPEAEDKSRTGARVSRPDM